MQGRLKGCETVKSPRAPRGCLKGRDAQDPHAKMEASAGETMSSTESSAPRQHAYSGPALPQQPEPSHAERTRTLLSLATMGSLSSLSRKHAGFPFGSLMPYALDAAG